MKVYIEDPNATDMAINGVPCTKVGVLKNGKTLTFPIDEASRKVFVIAGRMSASICNDFYQIPAGTEDVYLSGKNRYNPANGNAFRFDGVNDEEVLTNRKKSTKIGIIILILAVILGIVVGILKGTSENVQTKQFSIAGMSITLTDKFEQTFDVNCDVSLKSDYTLINGQKEEKNLFEEGTTLNGYIDLLKDANEQPDSDTQTKDGLVFFEYEEKSVDGTEMHHHYLFAYETDDEFWALQFVINADAENELESQVMKWAKTVEFEK
ncbi:MAG: hypothetical protein IJ462_00865 [Clostridia bacterium]|nr:hypothetical protein [Clostridia bacterium]